MARINSTRTVIAAIIAGVVLGGAPIASAQSSAKEPSVDKYLCIYANKCDGAAGQGDATMDAPPAKGFRVARAPGRRRPRPPRRSAPPPPSRRGSPRGAPRGGSARRGAGAPI